MLRARRLEESLGQVARAQFGIVSYAQLLGVGISAAGVGRRIREGRIRRLYRGIYIVGPLIPDRAREIGAVLACGGVVDAAATAADQRDRGRAVISHHSAAALWELIEPPAPDAPVDVTTPRANSPRRFGIRVHRVGPVDARDATVLDGLPITTPSRTICDLAGSMTLAELDQLVTRALARGITTRSRLHASLGRYAGRPGVPKLRALLGRDADVRVLRSEAEARFLALLRRTGAPMPAVNMRILGIEVDFLWRSEQVVVEVDGFVWHARRSAFEADRRRDAKLAAAGFRVVRVTWARIVHKPEALAFQLGQLIPLATD